MCGILGISLNQDSLISNYEYKKLLKNLLLYSQSRGKESSGIALNNGQDISVIKTAHSANKLLKSSTFKKLLSQKYKKNKFNSIIGHARLVTNGSMAENNNNQPVIKNGIVGIHNGIITNDEFLWRKYKSLKRKYQVDTEVLFSLFRYFEKKEKNIIKAIAQTFAKIEGAASIASYFNNYNSLILATNTGSLYFYNDQKRKVFIFASEKYILKKSIEFLFDDKLFEDKIIHIQPWSGLVLNLENLKLAQFKFKNNNLLESPKTIKPKLSINDLSESSHFPELQLNNRLIKSNLLKFEKEFQKTKSKIDKLKRCTKCILPETMPFIEFDEKGVCNYCRNHKEVKLKGEKELKRIVKKIKKQNKNKNYDCILPFSGGRDSSYALHYLVKECGLKPLAYTYDWGMITDLGRRNQARMCGQLGVEQILHSADIAQKRMNIKKNILAWLNKPDLGMIPLFMAGDKHYFYYLNKLAKQVNVGQVFYSSNPLEQTFFKTGFAKMTNLNNLNNRIKKQKVKAYDVGLLNNFKLIKYYLSQFIENPAYINSSLLDTVKGYFSSYLTPKNYYFLFYIIQWDEDLVNKTLIDKYNWELSPDSDSTWRIGDGTASFYNYLYYKIAGFTENDTFRSNQIRKGLITRSKALKLANKENQPRWESMLWYCNTIAIDFNSTIRKINRISSLY